MSENAEYNSATKFPEELAPLEDYLTAIEEIKEQLAYAFDILSPNCRFRLPDVRYDLCGHVVGRAASFICTKRLCPFIAGRR